MLVAAERLIGLGDMQSGLEWVKKSYHLVPSASVSRQIETLEGLINGKPARKRHDPMRIVAIVAAFNEGDVIREVTDDLIKNGVEVYLIDNHSTDNTVAEASAWLGKGLIGIEAYPPKGSSVPEGVYVWTEILRRKEELALSLDADWVIHADADEFREAPFAGMSLREGIELADRLGYNAIGFDLFNFRPTDNSFVPGGDVRSSLRYFERPGAFDLDQVKAWKNSGMRINLAASGGHEAQFPDRKVFPVPFILRHYPIRSEEHGKKKVFGDRIPRFSASERAKGWHVQYDEFKSPEARFLYRPEELTLYDPNAVRAMLLGRSVLEMMFVQTLQGDPDPSKLNGDRLMRKLADQLGYEGELSTDQVRQADQVLTAHFNAIMLGQPRPSFPSDELTLRLIFLLSRIKSAVSSQGGAYKAAAIWEAVGKKAGEMVSKKDSENVPAQATESAPLVQKALDGV